MSGVTKHTERANPVKNSKIQGEDLHWLRTVAMPALGVASVRVGWSNSGKKHPDIWLEQGNRIVVTKEWARQSAPERRKRLVHELAHVLGMEHGTYNGLNFSTWPALDSFSRAVYQVLEGLKL